MTRWRNGLMVGFAALSMALPLLAQTYHGGLRGAVRESGGVVPGASVTLLNEANGESRIATTNHAGEYAFVQVEPGTYTVKGGGVALETSNASVGSILDEKTIQTLPTAGRNPFFLATITPGVTHTGDPQFIRQQD